MTTFYTDQLLRHALAEGWLFSSWPWRAWLIGLLVITLPACTLQDKVLYYPDTMKPAAATGPTDETLPWRSSGEEYRGLVSRHKTKPPCGTVIVLHGNAGTAAERLFYVQALSAFGFRVILAEYPGYGGRTGSLGEKALVADGIKTIRLAAQDFGSPLFILGESLGAGVAAALTKAVPDLIQGVILITPWDTLVSVAQETFPNLPVRLLLNDTYDTITNLQAFPGKIAIVAAQKDEIIPISHVLNLSDSLPSKHKRLWVIKDAGHNNWPMHADYAFWLQLTQFMAGNCVR